MMNLLNEGNPELRALIFLPHYSLHEIFGACTSHRSEQGVDNTDAVMFTQARINREPLRLRCLNVALRNAWYELLERPAALEPIVAEMLSDDDFHSFSEA